MKTTVLPLIFVVDDDEMYHNLVKTYLKKNHLSHIQTFSSGEECIANLDLNPKIILLDYEMGAMNGVKTLRMIKEKDPSIQVIMLSGQDKLEVAVNAFRYGAYDYVVKNETAFKRIHQLVLRVLKVNNLMQENTTFRRKKNLLTGILSAVVVFTLYLSIEYYDLIEGR